MPPFDQAQFFEVFAAYNRATWPAPLVAYALGLIAAVLATRAGGGGWRVIWLILAGLWAWTGAVYHIAYFAEINPIAQVFGAAFLLQAGLLAFEGFRPAAAAGAVSRRRAVIGWGAVGYALVLYPALGAAAGHAYPAAPVFGVTPCPLTIFTFGLMLLSPARVPWRLALAPIAWAIVGGSAALMLGVPQDLALPVTAGLAVWALADRRRSRPAPRAGRIAREV